MHKCGTAEHAGLRFVSILGVKWDDDEWNTCTVEHPREFILVAGRRRKIESVFVSSNERWPIKVQKETWKNISIEKRLISTPPLYHSAPVCTLQFSLVCHVSSTFQHVDEWRFSTQSLDYWIVIRVDSWPAVTVVVKRNNFQFFQQLFSSSGISGILMYILIYETVSSTKNSN